MKELDDILKRIVDQRGVMTTERMRIPLTDYLHAIQALERIGCAANPEFVVDEHNYEVYEQLLRWLYADPDMQCLHPASVVADEPVAMRADLTRGIYLSGATGTGKSVALELLNLFAGIDDPKVRLGGNWRYLTWGCYRAEDIWHEAATSERALERYKRMPVLCIQDLGSEPATEAVYMGSRREPLRLLIEARGDRTDLITHFTSNYPIAHPELARRYGDRVVSRLHGMCNQLVLNGPDRRMR